MRAARILAIASMTLLASCALWTPEATGTLDAPAALTVSSTPVPLSSTNPDEHQIGKLIYRGGIHITANDPRFGGWSGLMVSSDGTTMLSQSDQAHWFRAHLVYDAKGDLAGVDRPELADMRALDGHVMHEKEGDAEGLAALSAQGPEGAVAVSFERDHRVWLYDLSHGLDAVPQPLAMPDAIKTLPSNSGLEGLTMFGHDRLLAVGEVAVPPTGEHSAWLVPYPGGTTSADSALSIADHSPYEISDASVGPDGNVYLLERHYFGPLGGIVAAVRRVPGGDVKPGATLDGEEIAKLTARENIDNMEGLSLRRGPKGETLLYVISDDNYSAAERTLLLMFEVQ